ncbi:MAG: ABC transporter substrate-binding protein [Gammaproteobacteria bacterium]|nr:ABC transporter substrate-binding protein [Gammaproteobacteria bacterium]
MNHLSCHRRNGLLTASMSRRRLLQGAAALSATAALPSVMADAPTTIRWWSTQSSPEQLAAYRYQIDTFERAHPGTRVVFERTSDEGYAAQLAAAFAGGRVPNLVTHLPSFAVTDYWSAGLLRPFDAVIDAVGAENFNPDANRIYEIDAGTKAAAGIGNTAANMLWLRTDLMQKAGIDEAPRTWDELRAACRKMQGRGVYGAPLPYARNSMTSLTIVGFIHQAGGRIFSPDLDLDLVSDEAVNALEYYRSMREFCPAGATSYSWGESLTAFVSGATATGMYSGRVLININKQNPRLAGHVTCTTYPTISADVPPWTFNDYPSVFIPAAAPDPELTEAFAAWLYRPDGYIRQMHATPGHVLPVLRTVANDPRYRENDIIRRYAAEVERMSVAASAGHNLGWETTRHRANRKAGAIINSGILAEMVQRVVLNGEKPRAALGDTARRIEAIMNA